MGMPHGRRGWAARRSRASPLVRQGQLIKELVADAQGDPAVAEDFRTRFFAHRRARGAATIVRGIESGELRADLNVDDVLDVLYGPLWMALLIGHRKTSAALADRLLALAWPALENQRHRPAATATG